MPAPPDRARDDDRLERFRPFEVEAAEGPRASEEPDESSSSSSSEALEDSESMLGATRWIERGPPGRAAELVVAAGAVAGA